MIRYVSGKFNTGEVDYTVYDGDQMLFGITLHRVSLLADEVYVKLRPYEGLKGASVAVLRQLKRDFNDRMSEENVGFNLELICQTKPDDVVGARFAEFFGFKLAGKSRTRLHYTKETV